MFKNLFSLEMELGIEQREFVKIWKEQNQVQ